MISKYLKSSSDMVDTMKELSANFNESIKNGNSPETIQKQVSKEQHKSEPKNTSPQEEKVKQEPKNIPPQEEKAKQTPAVDNKPQEDSSKKKHTNSADNNLNYPAYETKINKPINKITAGDLVTNLSQQNKPVAPLVHIPDAITISQCEKYPILADIFARFNPMGAVSFVEATNGLIQMGFIRDNAEAIILTLDINGRCFGPEPKVFLSPDPYYPDIEYLPVFNLTRLLDIIQGTLDINNINNWLYMPDSASINRLIDFASIKAASPEIRTAVNDRIFNSIINSSIFDMVKSKQINPRFVLEGGPITSVENFTLVSSGNNRTSLNGTNVPETTVLKIVYTKDGAEVI